MVGLHIVEWLSGVVGLRKQQYMASMTSLALGESCAIPNQLLVIICVYLSATHCIKVTEAFL